MARVTKAVETEVATPEVDTEVVVVDAKETKNTKEKTMLCLINCVANGKKFKMGNKYTVADIGDAVKFGAFK